MSNPRLQDTMSPDQVVDISATPPGDVHNRTSYGFSSAVGSLIFSTILTAAIIASWYMSNICVLLINKYLINFYSFRYPIFLTMLHMISCVVYSYVAIHLIEIVPHQNILSSRQFFKILALSAIFCFSICDNISLRYLCVCYHIFLVCVGSTAGRALKLVVQGILLTSDFEKIHSMNLLLYMAPMAACILLSFTLYIEGNVAADTVKKTRTDPFIFFLLLGNATVAYLVNLTNFLVTKHTNALTLQVLGNAKTAVAAVISVFIFRNPITVMGMTGFVVTVLYSEAKKRSKITAHW
ncbi:hypothetical protein ACFX11_019705 [Malus domestica]